jgi:hypothetical protein
MTHSNDRPTDVARSQGDRARSLDALHEVEQHAGAAGPNRPNEWRDDLLIALDDLLSSLHDQYAHSAAEDGLLSRVALDAPHLEPAVNELRERQAELMKELDGLRHSLADLTRPVDVATVRSRIGEMTAEIRELRAWETDIVYDAYAFDLGIAD